MIRRASAEGVRLALDGGVVVLERVLAMVVRLRSLRKAMEDSDFRVLMTKQ